MVAEEANLTIGGQLQKLSLTTPWSADAVKYAYDTAVRMRTVVLAGLCALSGVCAAPAMSAGGGAASGEHRGPTP